MSQQWILLVLFVLVLGSAVGVIFSKHESRKLFVQLQSLQSERDRIQVEWGRLQLEQSTWATHSRIERLARKKLDMTLPLPENVVIIRP